MHFFIEVATLVSFLACMFHAIFTRPGIGGWFFFSAALLGLVRENFVILRQYLYGFAPLAMMAGKAPVIAAIIWGFSIYVSLIWAEEITGKRQDYKISFWGMLLVSLFMISLAFYYEPFLKLIDMARWQEGTRTVMDVPLIAIAGYPTMTLLFLVAWRVVMTRFTGNLSRATGFAVAIPIISLTHVLALQEVKDLLGW